MPYTFIILKRETSVSLTNVPATPTAFDGFLLKITVEAVNDITDKIFVFQRDVNSNYVDNILDTFYSVTSVGELELIPEDEPEVGGTQFFRTNEVELMFESVAELEAGWAKIKADVAALSIANDASLTIDTESFSAYPTGAIPRYFGISEDLLTTGGQVVAAITEDDEYSSEIFFNAAIPVDNYAYVVLHRTLAADYEIHWKGDAVPTTVVTGVMVEVGDSEQSYTLYRTTDKIPAPDLGDVTFE